jgi:hypothetical protein
MAGLDFLESFFALAKKKFSRDEMDELFRSARAASGGKGKKKKRDEKESYKEEEGVEKAFVERPLNSKGFGANSTLTIVEEQGKFSHQDARYIAPARYAGEVCGGCRFYLRDPSSEVGTCQAVEGDIAWYGTSDYYISATEEAYVVFEQSHPQVAPSTEAIDVYKEDEEVEKKVQRRGDKYVVTDSTGKKVLGTHDTEEAARNQLKAIEAKKSEHWETEFSFLKQDEEKQIVLGVVMEPNAEDTQGEFSTAEEIEKAAHGFLTKSRIMGKGHESKAEAEVVESYITREDMDIEGEMVKKGSWVMAVKVYDAELWQGIKKGEFTGFSIGGLAMKIEGEIIGNDEEEGEEVAKGSALSALLNRTIDSKPGKRSEVIQAAAKSAGISANTFRQIVSGAIDCPPTKRLAGIAKSLGISSSSLAAAAKKDGCPEGGNHGENPGPTK